MEATVLVTPMVAADEDGAGATADGIGGAEGSK